MSRYSTRMDSPLWLIFRTCDGQTRIIHGKINQNADRRMWHLPYAYQRLPLKVKGSSRKNELTCAAGNKSTLLQHE